MGRNKASQSRKREERSKVKLKGHKTKFLPKGLNITDTRFKVRKIVVPDQLKIHSTDQPLTKKKLNIQDVLMKLRHHNINQRREGLQGLRELIPEADTAFFSLNLGNIINSLAKLALDPEKEIRHDNFKTLRLVLAEALEEVEPFFDTLSSYLGCAMTHIQISIQEDSLILVDILLEHTPFLIARSAQQVLPCFLDMISRLRAEQKPDRLLSVNLSGKLSAVQWRLQVLERLQQLLVAMLDNYKHLMSIEKKVEKEKGKNTMQTFYIASEEKHFYPIYSDRFSQDCKLQIFSQTGSSSAARLHLKNADEFKTYIDTLTNLLVECWLEVRPDTKKQQDKAISTEASVLLYSTFEIMQLLWDYFKLWEKDNINHDLDSWFREKYFSTLSRHFLPLFPYYSEEKEERSSEKGGGKWRKKGNKKSDGNSSIARPDCISQNLALCHLFIEMSTFMKTNVAQQTINYITDCVGKINLTNVEAKQLVVAIRCVFRKHRMWLESRINLEPLMLAMVERCSTQNHWLEQQLSSILLELLQIDFNRKFQRVSVVEKWITTLPQILCRNTVSIGTLQLFSKLACQKNITFLKALQQDLPSVLANMQTLTNCGQDGHLCLASLFYQVPEWSTEAETELKKQLDAGYVPPIVKEIVTLKLQNDCLLHKK